MPFKIFQSHSRSLILTPVESQCDLVQMCVYWLPDIEDSYADFLCRDRENLYWTRYFGETPKGTIRKFGMTKIETLRYFSFRVIRFRVTYFHFMHILGPKFILQIRAPICTKFQDMMVQSSVQIRFILACWKIAPFWNGPSPIGTGVDKNGSKCSKFCCFKPLRNLGGRFVRCLNGKQKFHRNPMEWHKITKIRQRMWRYGPQQ